MKKTHIGFLIIVLLLVPAGLYAEAVEISRGIYEVNGYSVNVTVEQTDGNLVINGRIDNGPGCERLKMTFTVENQKGIQKKITALVNDVGGLSSPIISSEKAILKIKSPGIDAQWKITDIHTQCTKKGKR